MTGLPPVIVLGVDTPIGLTVIRELGERGVAVHAIGRTRHAIGGASRWCAGFSVRGEGDLANWLPPRIREIEAKALFAITEGDLIQLAAMPEVVENCRILTPRAAPLALVLDKVRTLEAARAVGIDGPDSWQPLADEDFAARTAGLTYPLVAKWSDPPAIVPALEGAGLALHKAEHVSDAASLLALLDRYRALGRWPVIQQFCPGEGLGQMLHMAGGRATLRFQHRRIHEWPPEGGTSTFCESLPGDAHAAQMAKSEALLAAIGWEGAAMVEYRHDPATRRFWLMEINGRFWGSLPLSNAAGAHFAWEQYRSAFPEAGTAPRPAQRHARARFMIPETRRLFRIFKTGKAEGRLRALLSWLGGFFDPAMRYYVWSWRDPAPLFRDLANILRRAGRTERH